MPKEKSIKELEDLPGIGPTTAEKLKENGYDSVEKIAVASPHELSELVGLSVDNAKKAVEAARQATTLEYSTGSELYNKRKALGLSGCELPIRFCYCVCFKPASEKVVKRLGVS